MNYYVSYAVGPLNSTIGEQRLTGKVLELDPPPQNSEEMKALSRKLFEDHFKFNASGRRDGSLSIIALSKL